MIIVEIAAYYLYSSHHYSPTPSKLGGTSLQRKCILLQKRSGYQQLQIGYEYPGDCRDRYRDVSVSCSLGFGLSHPMNFGNESKLTLEYFSRVSPFSFFSSCFWKFHSAMNFPLSQKPMKIEKNKVGKIVMLLILFCIILWSVFVPFLEEEHLELRNETKIYSCWKNNLNVDIILSVTNVQPLK